MNNVYSHPDFDKVNTEFEQIKGDPYVDCSTYRAWTKFNDIQKEISKGRCPICEQKLDQLKDRESGSSIDHFRPKRNPKNSIQPKDVYSFLECEESNYILMCKGCNDGYKKSQFPLDTDFFATDLSSVSSEKPLLINLREENPLDYFELVFTSKYLPLPILELKRKKELPKGSYEYRKAEQTIKFFGLGKCHKLQENEKNLCRTLILVEHYESLYELAKAIHEEKDFEELLNENPKLMEYGFFSFLIRKQFKID